MGMALAGARLSGFDVINVGTDRHHTIRELLGEIFAAVGWEPAAIRTELDKPVGVKSRAADLTKSRDKLGWTPRVSLAEGVRRTAAWYAARYGTSRVDRLGDLLMRR